jgi:hypothetical protein
MGFELFLSNKNGLVVSASEAFAKFKLTQASKMEMIKNDNMCFFITKSSLTNFLEP